MDVRDGEVLGRPCGASRVGVRSIAPCLDRSFLEIRTWRVSARQMAAVDAGLKLVLALD
jgi:hypothetical protein